MCLRYQMCIRDSYIADSVEKRAAKGMNFGVAIIPEGVVEFVPEFSVLIQEINELLAGSKADEFNALATWAEKYAFIEKGLTKESMAVFAILPQAIQQQLFMEMCIRDRPCVEYNLFHHKFSCILSLFSYLMHRKIILCNSPVWCMIGNGFDQN